MSDNFENLIRLSGLQLTEARRSAFDWIKDKIKALGGNRRVPQTRIFQKNAVPEIGGMYLFEYDPKHKNTLPFWDTYPLVIPIDYYNDGILGINLHYLPPDGRITLLKELVKHANNDKFDRTTRMNINYRLLKTMSIGLSGDNGIIKRYLFSHVRSTFYQVDPSEWGQASLLPLQRFVQNRSPSRRKSLPY
jgi:hypothetical protein